VFFTLDPLLSFELIGALNLRDHEISALLTRFCLHAKSLEDMAIGGGGIVLFYCLRKQ
jgi:hypothetical protein